MMTLYHGSNTGEYEYLKSLLTARIIQILVEENGMSMTDAFDKVYSSDIFKKLSDPATGLYLQSPRYIMSYL
jgi:outer membrane biogenesis lipoprotein LolB